MQGWRSSMCRTAISAWFPPPCFRCSEYAGLDQIVAKFVDTAKLHPDAACFGVPWPGSQWAG